MNKQEFIEALRKCLASINDYEFVNDTISYYENYIESEIRMGKTEEEVMQQLGDPRLIAKSIRATRMEENEYEQGSAYREYHEETTSEKIRRTLLNINGRELRIPSWLIKILSMLIVGVVLFLVFTILRWMMPFIIMATIGYMLYKFVINLLS